MHTNYTSTNTKDMKKNFFIDFIICGLLGWCFECFWTGLVSLTRKDRALSCHTSIWMFPIYGMAACISPISKKLKNRCFIIRGGVYTIGIYIIEYTIGNLLKKQKACPWDYSKAKYNFKGLIRYDFAPIWFFVGLIYEKMLKQL